MEISILIMTYNHEKFIRQALDSVLAQQICVPYEILILDDASTDTTAKILKEYKAKHDQIITLYLRKKNSCHPTKNGYFLMSKAKGKYIAWIEGDDYWTDLLKIQKQYDFLEKNNKYSSCVTSVSVVDENNNEISGLNFYEKKKDKVYTVQDFRHIRTAGMSGALFMRNFFKEQDCTILYKASPIMGDITSFMLCALNGPIYQMDEIMAAYRYVCIPGENNFNSMQKENIYKDYLILQYWIKLENYMKHHYRRDFEILPIKEALKTCWARYSLSAMLHLIAQSENWKKYLMLHIAHNCLIDSEFILKNCTAKGRSCKSRWGIYILDRRPVILFGAGAVAKEYIDKYAWQGNILFLVDNDIRKQNKSFQGFLVKKPEEILKYKNIKVLITNKEHEDEIGNQLQNIGVTNYYCYCSMQSGRLKNITANIIFQKYGD